jgi:site-specific DNA recombinase
VGQTRKLAWACRPQSATLVAQLADPDRGWDAIVIGEYERAFYGSQYAAMAPLFEHYGVQLWMPEADGRVGYASEHDEKTMTALGLSSKREITRTSIRVRTAMAVQTREQGRYLGGRPPYGYRLADAGPHPNKAHAAWGRRAHRLEPDPRTAPTVRWIFVQRLTGHSVARIARALNEAGIPCPSAADPARNPHRTAAGWTLGAVTAILENPRYTGRQVWNRQRTDTELVDPANVTLGHRSVQRWNLPDRWVISSRLAHPALVSEDDFVAAQDVNAARGPVPQDEPVLRRYLLAGLLACGVMRAPDGVSLVQRQAGVPVPARPYQRDGTRPGPPEEYLYPRGQTPSAPACPAPAAHHSRRPRQAPHPSRSRRNRHCQPGRGDRVPARARDHPPLEPRLRRPAGAWHRDRQDRHHKSKLDRLRKP